MFKFAELVRQVELSGEWSNKTKAEIDVIASVLANVNKVHE